MAKIVFLDIKSVLAELGIGYDTPAIMDIVGTEGVWVSNDEMAKNVAISPDSHPWSDGTYDGWIVEATYQMALLHEKVESFEFVIQAKYMRATDWWLDRPVGVGYDNAIGDLLSIAFDMSVAGNLTLSKVFEHDC